MTIDLLAGWNMQIDFGLANPALFTLLSVPGRGLHSPAAQAGLAVLQSRVRRVASTGRLRVSEQRAVDLIGAAGTGAVLTLLSKPAGERDRRLAESMYAAVLREILTDASGPADTGPASEAVALRATASELDMLSDGERQLLSEWLNRVVDTPHFPP